MDEIKGEVKRIIPPLSSASKRLKYLSLQLHLLATEPDALIVHDRSLWRRCAILMHWDCLDYCNAELACVG